MPFAVANYTDDVRIFAGCLTGRSEWPTLAAVHVPVPRLAACLAHAELAVERVTEDAQRPRFHCRVLRLVTHAPFLFARHPGWHAFYDHEPVQAEATRRKVYDMLSAEKMLVQGFHYPFPSVAHVEKTATGYREIPTLWSPVL